MKLPGFARGLRFRLFIASLLIESVMMVVLVGNSLRLIDASLVRQTERRVTAMELAYKTAVALPLAARDYASLRDVLDGWRQADDITYLVVTDTEAHVLASSGWPADQALPQPSQDFRKVDVLHVRFPVEVLGQNYGVVHYGLSMEFLKTARHDLMLQGALIALAELLLSFLLLYTVGFWLTRHLAHLTEASSRIAAGSYQIRLPYASQDEVGQLTQNFNRMAEAVESRVTELATLLAQQKNILQALKDSNDRLTAFINALPDIVVIKDGQSRWQLINHAARDALALANFDWQGKDNCELAALRPAFRAFHVEAQASDELAWQNALMSLSIEHIFAEGDTPRISEVRKMPIFGANGERLALMVIARDITERLKTESQLRKLSLAVEQSPENIVITDLAGHIEYVNAAFVVNTGYTREELMGQNPRVIKSGKTPIETYNALWSAIKVGDIWRGEFVNRRKDGSEYYENATIAPVREVDGQISHYLAIKQDITEQRRTQAQIYRLAYHDSLTGLPNRTMLLERLELAMAFTKRQEVENALILFNLDRFKNINDARGHRSGDQLLVAVSERLGQQLREGDLLVRVAADEFACLLLMTQSSNETASRQALTVAEKVHTALRQPFDFGGEQALVSASLGITLYPLSGEDTPQDVLRRADTALHRAKDAGGNQSAFFDVGMGELTQQRFRIERELRTGIPAGELRLFIQPQVNAGGQVVSGEALVRWQHPSRGLLPPGVFIPIAEESDLIITLENWVTREACRLLAQEEMAGYPLHLSINICPRHFRQSGFVDWLIDLMQQEGNDPAYLTLEITEGMVIDNIDELIAKMNRLSKLGIHFSIDDFGTGYSSLAYLKRLPIHELKIDKTFVQDAPTDPDDGALVETILAIASHLHLKVVAEGVETQAQAEFLNARAEVIHQGYLYGRPEPADGFLARRRQVTG
jgi:diguanylate cyclase (GGDEF)-like protein/PAS domain S-box-containing protein